MDLTRTVRATDSKIAGLKLTPYPADTKTGKKKGDPRTEQRELIEPGLYLHLRQRSDGTVAKHWQYRAQVNGSRLWLSLGEYPAVGLSKAREELRSHQAVHEAAKKGEEDHPVMAALAARKAKRAQPTVAEVFAEWVADKRLGSGRKGGAPVRERTITVLSENFNLDIRDRIGDAKVAKLTPEAIRACIDGPRKRGAPGAAAHVYRTLRGLVRFAMSRDHITGADPMRAIDNPKPYRPAPVNAASDAEILALFGAVESSGLWHCTKLAIEFQLLTGARPGEVRLATWREFKLDRAEWSIPAERVKSGRAFRVHLSLQALAVLHKAKAVGTADGFVFPGAAGGAMEKMAVARALSRLTERVAAQGGKKLRPHDLRRTFRTLLARIGVQPHVAELCMNHQEKETLRRVYDGHDYGREVTEAWDRAGAHLQALRDGGAQVIALHAHAA